MSDEAAPHDAPPVSEQEIARDLRLRTPRPGVKQLSRKVIIGLSAVASGAILGATVVALQAHQGAAKPEEPIATDHKATADKLAAMPKDYTGLKTTGGGAAGVPQLGPPLPGDFGRPMLAAQQAGQPVAGPPMPGAATPGSTPPENPEAQRRTEEREGARLSKLFTSASLTEATPPTAAETSPFPLGAGEGGKAATPAAEAQPNGQDRKLAFLGGASDKTPVSAERLMAPASPYVVQAGTVIAGALVTGIQSDLPGQITGQVTQDVYDSPTGRFLLIPQGSKLIGIYDSQVTFGQSRVLLVWTRLILPNGQSITLERQPGADAQGSSGLQDGVNDHWGRLLKGALLSTLLSVGAEAGSTGQTNNLGDAVRRGASESVSQTGAQIVARDLNVQPTLTIRSGYEVRVIVNRDLVLAPYGG